MNIFHRTCFTIASVPYSSLTARISDDSEERTKLTTARMLGASFGTLSISALGFQLSIGLEVEESLGFVYLGICSGLAAILILAITVKTVKERNFDIEQNYPAFPR